MTVDPETPLLFVLNDELGLRGPRFGCGMAQCGSCTVIMRGQVVRSCVMPVSAVDRREITTLEGIGTPEHPHPLQAAFVTEQAAQCGYCVPGMVMSGAALLAHQRALSRAEVRILPERRDPDGEGRARCEPARVGRRDA